MTENTPDAVEEIAAIIRDHSSKPYSDQASRNAAKVILSARAMQAAMPAPAGVRVKALREAAEEAYRVCAETRHIRLGDAARAAILAIEDAGARERAALCDCERGHNGLGMSGRECDCTPTPAPGDLVERLRWGIPEKSAVAGGGQVYDFNALHALMTEAASRIEALEAEVARLRQAVRNDTATIGQYEEHRQKLHAARSAAEARATTAEAGLGAWRERESETQEALQKIGEEFGIHGGEPRVDGLLRVLREQRADLAALRAEVERLREALTSIAEHPGPNADDAAWCRVEDARDALTTQAETTRLGAAITKLESLGKTLPACRWPEGVAFGFRDDPGEHEPCYVIMPDGGMIVFNHHAEEGVDIARARFVQSACNAALAPAKGG